jgi:pyruvate dehydrogenase E1 component alpha subunit
MQPNLWLLFAHMYRSRLFEIAVAQLWRDGHISGEMHLGTGEEAINAGVVSHLIDGDAMALDHRGTAPLLIRGVNPILLLREFLGHPEGLCGGMGGHMHLFSKEHLAASSGIVGASGPAAVGFALAAEHLRPGKVAVAFFGEAAINQGMLMESFNLAVAWNLPVIFVCKDDDWAITTRTSTTSPTGPSERARGFGLPVLNVNGNDVLAVYQVAGEAIQHARGGGGPSFIHATCAHTEGHLLDLLLVRTGRSPIKEGIKVIPSLLGSALTPGGASIQQRVSAVVDTLKMIWGSAREHRIPSDDPIKTTRKTLAQDPKRLQALETEVAEEIIQTVRAVLQSSIGETE